MASPAVRVMNAAIEDRFVTYGSPEELERLLGLDAESIAERILTRMNTRKKH